MAAWKKGGKPRATFAERRVRIAKKVGKGAEWSTWEVPVSTRYSDNLDNHESDHDGDAALSASSDDDGEEEEQEQDAAPPQPSTPPPQPESSTGATEPPQTPPSPTTTTTTDVDLARHTEPHDADADASVRLAARNQAAYLSLANRNIPRLPRALVAPEEDELLVVETLDVSANRLSSLPLGICLHLPLLNKLEAHHNLLEHVPPELCMCRFLQDIDVSHNRLASLPTGLFVAPSLARLEASSNSLQSLPSEIAMSDSLVDLGVAHNRLTRLPEETALLRSLARIDAEGNRVTALPTALFEGCTSLRLLLLARNRLRAVVPHNAPRLEALDVAYNALVDGGWLVGDAVAKLPRLRRLMAQGNQLGPVLRLGVLLEQSCPRLAVLELANNRLASIEPPAARVANSSSLHTLGVSHNRLTMLPESFGGLEEGSMRMLVCHSNRLRSLPPALEPLLAPGVTPDDVLVRPHREDADPADARVIFGVRAAEEPPAGNAREAVDPRFDVRMRVHAPTLLGYGYGLCPDVSS